MSKTYDSKKVCFQFVNNGVCDFIDCKYSHDSEDIQKYRKTKKGTVLCRHYPNCNLGDKCNFHHPIDEQKVEKVEEVKVEQKVEEVEKVKQKVEEVEKVEVFSQDTKSIEILDRSPTKKFVVVIAVYDTDDTQPNTPIHYRQLILTEEEFKRYAFTLKPVDE